MALEKIVSGGQTGVDRGALDAALACGFPCGGWCPAGRLAEDGPIADRYPLRELPGGGYLDRTIRNLEDSDGTLVLFFGDLEGGTQQTVLHCRKRTRPCKLIDLSRTDVDAVVQEIVEFIAEHGIRVLNVAGPRASKVPTARRLAFDCIARLLSDCG